MSTKNNAMIGAVSLALGLVVTADAVPICEGLLNDLSVTGFDIAEVDTTGKVMVICTTSDGKIRPVADSLGNVKLYMDGNAAIALAKRANIASGVKVRFVKADKTGVVGDPVAALKAKYKSFKNEAALGVKQLATVDGKKTAGVALGWDTATGTPEHAEYLDLVDRSASIGEWLAYNQAKVTALAASLVAAGIDPATVV